MGSQGWTPVDETQGWTPVEEATSAKATGAGPAVGPQIPKNYGFTAKNLGQNLWEGAKGAVEGTYALGKDLVQNPNWVTGPNSTLNKFVVQPAAEMKQKAQTAPTTSESLGYSAAEAIPFVGPWAAHLGEQAGTGDIGGAAASGVGTAATFTVAPEIAKRVGAKAIDMPSEIQGFRNRAKGVNDVTRAGAGVYQSQIQPIFRQLQGLIQNEGARTMEQAIAADKAAGTKTMPVSAISETAKAISDTGYTPSKAEQAILDKLSTNQEDVIAQSLGVPDAVTARARFGEPAFNSMVQQLTAKGAVQQAGLSLDEAVKLRTSLGSAASKAERASNAKGAKVLWTAYNELGENMANRVKELQGSRAPYDHYNNEFKAYFELNKGTPGSMMDNLTDRHDSIPKLKEFAKADLTEVKQQMKKYGMDPAELDKAQKDARYVGSAYDSLSGIYKKSLYRLVMGGASASTLALPIAVYAAAHGAGLYGLAPMLLASYFGSKVAGVDPEIQTGRILRKLNVNPDVFQVRTPVEGPQDFKYPGPTSPTGGGGGGEPSPPSSPASPRDLIGEEAEQRLGTAAPPEQPKIKGVGNKLGTPEENKRIQAAMEGRGAKKQEMESSGKSDSGDRSQKAQQVSVARKRRAR